MGLKECIKWVLYPSIFSIIFLKDVLHPYLESCQMDFMQCHMGMINKFELSFSDFLREFLGSKILSL